MNPFAALLFFWTAQSVSSYSSPTSSLRRFGQVGYGKSSIGKRVLFSSSYLDSLSGCSSVRVEEETVPAIATIGPLASSGTVDREEELPPFAHVSMGYFGLDQLKSKDPRATADWGKPQEATRPILPAHYHGGKMLTAGSWSCSEGGWPSPSPKAHTEVFYVLDGHCSMDDADGSKHYFGPGDTVIIPKGHTGRWDIYQPIHKVWTSHHHSQIENPDPRVQVIPYSSLSPPSPTAPVQKDVLYGTASAAAAVSCQTFYDLGPTKVGAWNCVTAPSSFSVVHTQQSIFFHLLEGVMYLSDAQTGHARRCIAGDTVLLPAHWSGYIDILQPVKKIFTTAASTPPQKPSLMEWIPNLHRKV